MGRRRRLARFALGLLTGGAIAVAGEFSSPALLLGAAVPLAAVLTSGPVAFAVAIAGLLFREVVTVTDADIAVAMTTLLERSKTLVEGAGAVPIAALLAGAFEYDGDETIVPVLCGGNVDMNTLTTVIMRGLIETGRYVRIRTVLPDRPGALDSLVEVLSEYAANIYALRYDRTSRDVSMDAAEIEIDLETRGHDHFEDLLEGLAEAGYDIDVLTERTPDGPGNN
jgi:threonine dehydratase